MAERLGAVVIGAGQAGLAASHQLTRLGRDHVVLEQAQVASVWRRRWDSFTLVTPNWTIRLPGAAYAGNEPDGFMPRDDVVAHLERYAAGAPVRTGVRATAVDPDPMEAALPSRIHSLHTDEYRNPEALPPGGVLIVGSGQSGCQVSEELLEAARDVYLSVGSTGRMRRRYRGRDTMAWAWDLGMLNRPASSLESPRERYASNPHVSGKRGGAEHVVATIAAEQLGAR